MRNYLAAECYKTFRRKYFYIILAVCLGLEAVLLWGYWTTWKWGNSNVDFYSTAIMVPFMLSIGLYATIVTGDIREASARFGAGSYSPSNIKTYIKK